MKITVLGSASGMPVKDRAHSSYLLEVEGYLYLIDAGEGVSRSLVSLGVDHNKIIRVFISHTHPDHCAGIPMLLQMMMMSGRKGSLEIYLPQQAIDAFDLFLKNLYIFREGWPFGFDLLPLLSQMSFEEGDLTISTFPTNHLKGVLELAQKHGVGIESNGFIFSKGPKKVIYTSDFGSLEDIAGYVQEADLLIIEGAHAPLEEIVSFIRERAISRSLITHLPPELEGKEKQLEGLAKDLDVSFAIDGMVLEV